MKTRTSIFLCSEDGFEGGFGLTVFSEVVAPDGAQASYVLGIKSKLAICKASGLSSVQCLWPALFIINKEHCLS